MYIPVVDDLAWLPVRIASLIDAYIFEALSRIKPPYSLKDKIDYMSRIHGGYYIALTPKEEIPEMVREQLTKQGRLLLVLILFFVAMARLNG